MSLYWLVFVLALTVSIPVVVGIYYYHRLDAAHRSFLYLLLCILITEVIAHFYRALIGNNMIIFNIYTVFSAILIGRYIYNLTEQKMFLYTFYLIGLFSIVETIIGGTQVLSSHSINLLSVVTIGVLIYVFYLMATLKMDASSMVINGGMIFYFMSNFLYFSTSDNLLKTNDMDFLLAFGITKSFTNTICYGWYAVGLWKPTTI